MGLLGRDERRCGRSLWRGRAGRSPYLSHYHQYSADEGGVNDEVGGAPCRGSGPRRAAPVRRGRQWEDAMARLGGAGGGGGGGPGGGRPRCAGIERTT